LRAFGVVPRRCNDLSNFSAALGLSQPESLAIHGLARGDLACD
jgi:hypothetical protein